MTRPRELVATAGRRVVRRTRQLLRTPRERLVDEWLAANGDITLRLDFPLDTTSVVMDVGGYQGQYAGDIYSAFRCRVHVYEPIPAFAAFIGERFTGNPDIVVHDYGLAANTRTEQMHLAGDATSALDAITGAAQEVRFVSILDELSRIGPVSLLKLNIEGLEYELLEAMLDNSAVATVDHFVIQFHDFAPDAAARRERIRASLAATHELRWDYPFVWEAWSRCESS